MLRACLRLHARCTAAASRTELPRAPTQSLRHGLDSRWPPHCSYSSKKQRKGNRTGRRAEPEPEPEPDTYHDPRRRPLQPVKDFLLSEKGICLGLGIFILLSTVDYLGDQGTFGFDWYEWGQDTKRNPPMGPKRFGQFSITDREQISPTSFVLTLEPTNKPHPWSTKLRKAYHTADDSFASIDSRPPFVHLYQGRATREPWTDTVAIARAWAHGNWHVEVKQPLIQVVREYTPLPPRYGHEADDLYQGRLRLLVRTVQGGEVSTYLAGLRVGNTVEVRGPHLNFDVHKRLGTDGTRAGLDGKDAAGMKKIVFLAGGTGLAPAMQVARAALDKKPEAKVKARGTKAKARARAKAHARDTSVHILWANRQRADCQGCEELQEVRKATVDGVAGPRPNSIMAQLSEMRTRHGDRFTMACTVDEENTFVDEKTVLGAISPPVVAVPRVTENPDCPWHSQTVVARSTEADASSQPASVVAKNAPTPEPPPACLCGLELGGGKNLLMVSGPEGFVQSLAGPKTWAQGKLLQGPVRGVIGELNQKYPDLFADWLVLKL